MRHIGSAWNGRCHTRLRGDRKQQGVLSQLVSADAAASLDVDTSVLVGDELTGKPADEESEGL